MHSSRPVSCCRVYTAPTNKRSFINSVSTKKLGPFVHLFVHFQGVIDNPTQPSGKGISFTPSIYFGPIDRVYVSEWCVFEERDVLCAPLLFWCAPVHRTTHESYLRHSFSNCWLAGPAVLCSSRMVCIPCFIAECRRW